MRLHRIDIKNFRGVDHFDLSFDADGVTIVEGDNEIGKSCVPEALDLVLEALDSAKTKQVKAIKPVHSDAGPEVEVEISTGDYRFVLTKRWLKQASTTLTVTKPNREQLTGREAHERVQAILSETLDRDLWAALSVRQGDDLTLPAFNVAALGRALDAASGGDVSTPHDENLWDRIQSERDLYWTPGGQPNAHRKTVSARRTQADEDVQAIQNKISQMQEDIAEVERLEAAMPDLERQRETCHSEETELVERGRLAGLAVACRHIAQTDFDAATSAHTRAGEKLTERQELVRDVERAGASVANLLAAQAAAAPAERDARTRHEDAQLAVEQARSARNTSEKALRLAEGDTAHTRQKIEVSQFNERLARVNDAQASLGNADEITDRIRVTSESLQEIDERHIELVRAEAALGLGAANLRLEALCATTVTVAGEDIVLAQGAIHEASVPGSVELELPGTLRLSVTAGGSVQELADEVTHRRQRYVDACSGVGAVDVADARAQLADRQSAEQQARTARASIQAALRDLTPDAIANKIESLGKSIKKFESERPSEPAAPSTHDDAQDLERMARAAFSECEDAVDSCERAFESSTTDLHQVRVDSAGSVAKLEAARGTAGELETRLDVARTQDSDEALEAAARAAKEQLGLASIARQEADRKVREDDPELLNDLIANAAAATKRVASDISSADERRIQAMARLSLRGNDGLQHQLDVALTALNHVEYEHDSLERRAEAAQMLYRVAAACREDIRRRYHGPFREQIERLGRVLFDPTFEVELDDDLRIAKRTLGGITLGFEQLSAGAREQLGIVCRLACAIIVSEDGGAPVLLDDTLGWTDPTRLGAMGAIIAVAGKGCQVIVLTCTPGRYSSIGEAQIVRLVKTTIGQARELVEV